MVFRISVAWISVLKLLTNSDKDGRGLTSNVRQLTDNGERRTGIIFTLHHLLIKL